MCSTEAHAAPATRAGGRFRELRAAAASDPTGYATRVRVLGRSPDAMEDFEQQLRRYILELR